ncbi:MAG: response regulator transcription factor [Longibaculum muris]|uniref:DNA-binding response OmpR family regulator n=1 Tax=Longibaculum muris TaxID=1796628 RepID=A0A4R3YG47_9FIRM|nr:response regulator transcription factor [Longibaculum muris]KXU52359.1 putative transcriptional regulatory protein ResD [Candidatus Stoquefichus sp. KLE1796]MCR1889383.1 response regulator transcription factor [Longibaculum muris]MED9810884.1 response regulator transcription factor [Longibaculum muris]TCV91187.1 DNA-binding response OmpR family regulator [Longibaculum muris]
MKVLLIEDEKLIRMFIVEYFDKQKASVVEASDGYEGLSLLDDSFDIVLLDIMMPGIDGYEVCKLIRQKSDVPILFISALSEDDNKLKGYDLGADDFISKPFTPSLLYAKCKALLKRVNKENRSLDVGIIHIDEDTHEVYIRDELIQLSNKEYLLLIYFIENRRKILSRDQLLDHIWGYDYYGDQRIVDTYVKKLRKKLLDAAPYIQTVVKIGYMFDLKEL